MEWKCTKLSQLILTSHPKKTGEGDSYTIPRRHLAFTPRAPERRCAGAAAATTAPTTCWRGNTTIPAIHQSPMVRRARKPRWHEERGAGHCFLSLSLPPPPRPFLAWPAAPFSSPPTLAWETPHTNPTHHSSTSPSAGPAWLASGHGPTWLGIRGRTLRREKCETRSRPRLSPLTSASFCGEWRGSGAPSSSREVLCF